MADNDKSTDATVETDGQGDNGFSEAFASRAEPEQKPAAAEEAAASGEAAEAASASAPADAAASEGSGTKAEAFDPFAGMSPELRSHWEKVQASERSNRGRVGALTRKLNGMTAGTQAPPQKKPEGNEGGEGEEGTGTGNESQASDLDKRFKDAAEEYGDIVGPVAEVVQSLREEIAGLKASATRHEVEQDANELAEAYATLGESHPDYETVAADAAFHKWAGEQPDSVKALLNSYDPREVSLGLTLYKAEAGIATKSSRGDGGEGEGTATGDKRKRQLDGLRQTNSGGQPVATGVGNDFSSAFKARAHRPN